MKQLLRRSPARSLGLGKRMLLVAAPLWIACCVASAGITTLEHFDSAAAGDVVGQGSSDCGWAGVWAAGPASSVSATVSSSGIEFAPMGANKVGGLNSLNMAGSGTGVPATRQLSAPRSGTFFVGCLMKFSGTLNTEDIYTVGFGGSATDTGNGFNFGFRGVAAGSASHFFIRKGTATPSGGPLLSASGSNTATRYLVLKVEKTAAGNYNKVTGWINPHTMSEAMSPDGDMQLLTDLGVASLSHVILRASGVDTGDSGAIDHLVLGTGFADIVSPFFGIFPLYGSYSGNAGTLSESQALAAIGDLKTQIGENRGQFRVGFGGIYGGESTLDRNCRLARDNNLSHSVIIGTQTHALPSNIKSISAADFRNYQWRRDGVTWEGVEPTDNRDWQVVTPSRYATALRSQFETNVRNTAQPIKRQMDNYPGVIVNVNACIEEELATGTGSSTYMGDYSPYAITEFRDWLRHTGMYDADTGTYPTEGAPAAIVGNYISIGGKLRSPFYDDPAPGNANGTGASFNSTFGTSFTSWTLRNWDLIAYPSAITNPAFDPTPSSGSGFTSGGFDAPRTVTAGNAFWRAWSWDWQDQGDIYPPRNPAAPAFGFRQVMIRNFVNDLLAWVEAEGIPANLITAHQIPGEMLFSDNRARTAATPVWTGLSKANGTVGITRYGTFNTTTLGYLTQYTDFWSVHEWHPRQGETDDNVLRTYAMNEIEKMVNNKCRLVQPFSWTGNATYPVKDSGFAVGLKDWMDAKIIGQTPTITSLSNQSVATNTPTSALAFTVGDDVIPAGAVVVTRSSSNPTLIPMANIVITGTGANRSVTVTPASGQTGMATITLTVSDGSLASTSAFQLTVASNQPPTVSAIDDQSLPENTPSEAIVFTVGDDSTPVASLEVTGSSSNPTLVPSANIVLGGSGANRTLIITSAANQVGSATITVQVSDGTLTTSTTFEVTVLLTLFSDFADSAPRQVDGQAPSILTSTAMDSTLYAGRGGTGGSVDRCIVFPFQLPQLGVTTTPFTLAELTFNLVSNNFSPVNCNLDLYGLAARDTATVLASDYYSETDVMDPASGTVRLQDDLCAATSTAGLISSSIGGVALMNYLNVQYANGTNAGKYVFLRLNKDTANGANSKQYVVTAADGAAAIPNKNLWPQISYSAVAGNFPPTITDIASLSIPVDSSTGAIAFTVGDGQSDPGSLTLDKSSSNPELIPLTNIVFGGSGLNRTVTVTPVADQLGTSTLTVTVSDGVLTASDSFVLTVTGNGIETWRFQNFGSTANTGNGADIEDPNGDGESNLLEFATGQGAMDSTLTLTPISINGGNIEFIYTQSLAAMDDGVTFSAEWSDDLDPPQWSGAGFTERVLSDNGVVQTVEASVVAGSEGLRFIHLRILKP